VTVQAPESSASSLDLSKIYIRVRADLQVTEQTHQERRYYVIKDPVSLRYFRCSPVEYKLFTLFDGTRHLGEVVSLIDQLYPDRQLTADDVLFFVQQLKNCNFLENLTPQQGALLYERGQLKRKQRSLWRQIRGILYVKIPLVDPDRTFNRLMPYLRFLWSRWFSVLVSLSFVTAVVVVISNWGEMEFSLSALISPSSLGYLWIALVLSKVVHELSHGLTCKHFGGEVHEMGFLLLVLVPCLYCNISDAWTFQSRWKKFATSFAGIFGELFLASLAAIIWWLSAPGVLNSLMYRVMFLSSVSAVLINASPLMRFDGYYILSDLLGMPNLRTNSFNYLKTFLQRYVLGMRIPGAELSTRAHQIHLFYGVAALIWLVSLVTSICIAFLIKLPALGLWITLTTVYGTVFLPANRLLTFVRRNRDNIPLLHWPRVTIPLAILAGAVYLLGFLPTTSWVVAPAVVVPAERAVVRAEVPGFLNEVRVTEGEHVEVGQTLAKLDNPQVAADLFAVERRIEALEVRITEALGKGELAFAELVRESQEAWLARRRRLREQLQALTLRSPVKGVVITPRLDWLQGIHLEEGQSFCEVAALGTMLARIVVNERDLAGLAPGSEAEVLLKAYPSRPFAGRVQNISPKALQRIPDPALSARSGGDVPTYPDAEVGEVPTVQLFELTIEIANPEGRLRPGMTGTAKVEGPSRTLAGRALTYILKRVKTSFHLR